MVETADIVQLVLDDLRGELGDPGIVFAEAPRRLTGGFDTTIYTLRLEGAGAPFDVPLVIRIFGPGDGPRAAREAAAQAAIAAQGYPAPPVLLFASGVGPLGRPYALMPLVEGGTLLQAGILHLPGRLAKAHLALHTIDPAPVRRAIAEAGMQRPLEGLEAWLDELRERVNEPGMERFQPVLAWFQSHQPPSVPCVVCHLDFHPLNLIAKDGEVRGVVDWGNLDFGDPEADVAVTRVILLMGPVQFPRGLGWAFQLARRWVAWRYLRAYRRGRRLRGDVLGYYEALRAVQAIAALSQRRLRERQGIAANAAGYAWSDPAALKRLRRRVQQVTGLDISPVE